LIYLGQRKITDDKLDKLKTNEENVASLDNFLAEDGRSMFLFAIVNSQGGVNVTTEP
jgi:hypothetical protein